MGDLAGICRPEGGMIVGNVRKTAALLALAVLTMTTVAVGVGVSGAAQAAPRGSSPLSATSSALATQNGQALPGTPLPTEGAHADAPRNTTSSYGFLSIFQEASSTQLNVSIDNGAATALKQGGFVYGLVTAGVHLIRAKGGSIDVTGTVTVGAGQNVTSLVYLAPGGGVHITGFLNNRSAPGPGNSRIVMRNTANTGPVDVYINGVLSNPQGTNLANNPSSPQDTGSISVPAGQVTILVTPHGQPNTTLATTNGGLVAGDLLNVFVVSDSASTTGFSLLTNANPLGAGYRLYASDGGVFSFGSSVFSGSLGGKPLNEPVVGAAPTQIGLGYWMVAADGGVFSFGNANFYGSAGNIHLNKPVVGMAGAEGDLGYWLVASDGGVFSYGAEPGDAPFYGSTGGMTLNKPVVGMAATPDGKGYWLVASDGGVFAYGDANFYGSTGGMPINKPIVAIAPTVDGKGYWLIASDGGVFAFGDATFLGSMGGTPLNEPVVSGFTTPDSLGYWLVASDGGVFSFGDAGFFGSTGGIKLDKPIVAGSNPGVAVPTS
jgi:hypothetical protein